ncbi:MAG TPA: hypothetical protein VFS20_29905 [Longimicrobium sp.]|nr:hypothetical protein [Longimicrobium sp.]
MANAHDGDDTGAQVAAAELEMFTDVVYGLFLGLLAANDPPAWTEPAAWRLSRSASPVLLNAITTSHAAGMRQEARAEGLAAAVEALLSGDSDRSKLFPAELAVLVVPSECAGEILERVRAGLYSSTRTSNGEP